MNFCWNLHCVIRPWTISLLCLLFSSFGPCPTVSALECYCEGDGCPEHHINNTCVAPLKSKCFASIRESIHEGSGQQLEPIFSYGCLPEDESTIMQCKGNLVPHRMRTTIMCCDDKDFCNEFLHPELKALTTTMPPLVPRSDKEIGIAVAVVAVMVFVLVGGLVGCCCFRRYRKRKLAGGDRIYQMENQALVSRMFSSHPSSKDMPEQSMTSGSGSGLPLLVQCTVAKQLQFIRNIGKGRYGEVWHARFRDEDVAVKIFSTLDEASWESEKELYQTCMLPHENILGFKAADIGGTGSCTQMLLVTDYHRASLFDFLKELSGPLDFNTMVKMAHCVAQGLSHLHAGISGTNIKPPIAHRDIKTKNILVKMDGVNCVIADFGLAIREDAYKNGNVPDTDKRQGTRRYMAPEILDFSIQRRDFEAFKQADAYSFGLVLWELMRCTNMNGSCEGHQLPYYDCVGQDPSFDDMRYIVCDLARRPDIPREWLTSEPTETFVKVMQECWSSNPKSRLTALRAKKTLYRLQQDPLPSTSA